MNLANDSNVDIANNPAVYKRINQEVEMFNQGFGNWEQLKKFVLLQKEFTIEGDELTPTLKLKRKKILAKYHKEYQSIYS
jgi:long-chain acyl-CoA synthetase